MIRRQMMNEQNDVYLMELSIVLSEIAKIMEKTILKNGRPILICFVIHEVICERLDPPNNLSSQQECQLWQAVEYVKKFMTSLSVAGQAHHVSRVLAKAES